MKKIVLLLCALISFNACTKKETVHNNSVNTNKQGTKKVKALSVYQSCGAILITNTQKKLNVFTMLPILKKGGAYQYIKYYNISSPTEYGILGVLVVKNEPNIDLRNYQPKDTILQQVDSNPIDLTKFSSFNGGKDFTNLTNKDIIYFVCFHDDNFLTGNQTSEDILKFYQKNLPNVKPYEIPKPLSPDIPKVGDGGILTINGCQ